MSEQIFADGIGSITIIGNTVRLDFVAYSPTEKEPGGQPKAVHRQRIVMTTEGFLPAAAKIHEAVQAVSKLGAEAHRPSESRAAESPEEPPANQHQAPPAPVAAIPPKRPFP